MDFDFGDLGCFAIAGIILLALVLLAVCIIGSVVVASMFI